ncbi:hypothetical protein [Mycolicibacterium monacense]|uniref:Polyketide cyclase / dehydrase and lipid transport n=1 Tax=Mycolicibacterium monacense TaxID=85693 RepID=A0AAD1IXF3_MYCMB|nr:hypothetical protein [Mycolicibacterium monacense]MDA4101325.1 hypothetical protein [Mycolicibacterium monacense DSM 44395]OBF56095.1 hypothetical protein A5778_07710 [Mycolicibacterium monacense]ORB20785.1 hypothetical protein BST34_11285 [Mycolicibacterium monacense DSM 44395]QHP84916.1 hypothetical protein EWR22_05775 [Mycolicibacterium monacense DSM 44395]BBZ62268.1 hypothetical protein MMON_35690 [Mycolicibacterium monacense]
MGRQRPLLADALALAGLAALYHFRTRPWIYTWGARDEELTAPLPGDELVAGDPVRTTRAVTVDAPVSDVWPWLAQIGEDRGGFYSYWLLERAVGAGIHNADVIHPEWQDLQVGDTIWLARRYGPAARQIVAAVAAESHLVLMSPADFDRVRDGTGAGGCWSFVLRPERGGTRLLVRGSGKPVGHFWFDIPHFIMEQKMMRGIAARAQRTRHRAAVGS